MKNLVVFRVVTEIPGETRKVPGETTTELRQMEYRYAAETIEDVMQQLMHGPLMDDEKIMVIHEEHPAIIVLEGEK